ncbi:MAG: flippase-like domain-containing protein, partial [Chloroflexota bacterium]|nr:flippase-like domain-containing protein [Chloroflexota bacterium]
GTVTTKSEPSATRGLRGKIAVSILFGLLVFVGLALYADVSKVTGALLHFAWPLLPAILALTLVNYAVRFLKWHFYLGQLRVRMGWRDSLRIFVSGFAMSITPGKVGEFLKSYLVKEVTGAPMAGTMPIVVCERLTDGVAMLLLASGGLLLFGYGWRLLLAASALALLTIFAVQYRPLALSAIGLGERVPRLTSRMHHLHAFYDGAYRLLTFRNLAIAVGMGLVSWTGECLAFYLVLLGLGFSGPVVVIQAFFVLASATVIGSLSLLPGGLGVADGSITGLLLALSVTGKEEAVAATLLIRFCTLWFGVSLGLLTLASFGRRPAALTGVPAIEPSS